MLHRKKGFIIVPAILLAASPLASYSITVPSANKISKERTSGKKLSEPDPWSGKFELGYNNQSGNTNNEALHSALKLIYDKTLWKNTLSLQADSQYSDKKHTAEEYKGSDQLDFTIDEKQYVFGRLSYDKNHFSGYDYQSLATAGYGYKVLTGPINILSFEAGAGYTYNRTHDHKNQSGIAGRLAGNYTWNISDLTQFSQSLSLNSGAGNNKVHSETALETAISGPLHLKLAYLVDYNSKVPSTYKHTDKQMVASVIYKF